MKKTRFAGRKKQAGFGLLEVLITVAILSIIATLAAPTLFSRGDTAKVAATKAQISSIVTALSMYKLDNQVFPSTNQGLDALVEKPSGYPQANNWSSDGYMRKLPKDGWGNDFLYISPGSTGPFEIISYGSDGVSGGEDTAADILSSEL
ncbi:type II secretion system major pseudopilin GspG [Marinomonas sp. C2222]|uniref:Type II secretion system core protein G n=1 Tax=Marinomonas sargassi TaxID=2984494 RepID=A0ABT2YNJ2_9GAMM|nr:type II secretion system major pseudopilin GspG [Marinomonas sargassi]MCV2401455.1 type II secretion system major pseudopilin GspG [Marinomonas sargassi]